MELSAAKQEKVKLREVNPYLTCYLCKGYLIDATTISECLHSFCRSCIIKFLQDNSHCPVCEVIINKAKPNLKLDKTLQDIVYKLVPELFLKEMTRRKLFYKSFPEVAAKLAPEERGEDTERTIYNPQDCISLSMEYISDDSSPGAIQIPDKNEDNKESIMKRYLQCPGMCRVDVLKKFVRNKYNVDTTKFYIDILHKRVPLPDHYTLIDIAYIYAWKRNEPMKFFFRITDLNKIGERFDHFDATKANFEYFPKPPTRRSNEGRAKRRESNANRRAVAKLRKEEEANPTKIVCDSDSDNKSVSGGSGGSESSAKSEDNKGEEESVVGDVKREPDKEKKKEEEEVKVEASTSVAADTETSKTYTNITLNRTEGVEIITKIQEVQNKEGKPIGHQIVQTVRKGGKVAIPKLPRKIAPKEKLPEIRIKPPEVVLDKPKEDPFEDEKCKFLKNIELTAKTNLQNFKKNSPESSQKRKISSPVKTEKTTKKPKVEKKGTTKIIITQKPSAMLKTSKLLNEPSSKSTIERDNGLQSLIDSCKISIPSSLSITIKENCTENRLPTLIPPVKNYIEILKLPDEDSKEKSAEKTREKINELASKFSDTDSEQKVDQDLSEIAKSLTEKIPISTTISHIIGPKSNFQIPVQSSVPALPKFPILPSPVPELPPKIKEPLAKSTSKPTTSSFQKIFEESIKKPVEPPKDSEASTGKRNLMEIASQLHKKSKADEKVQVETKNEESVALPKVPIPRLPKKTENETKTNQTVSNLHSTSLGLNYSVSVGQKSPNKPPKINGTVSPIATEEKTSKPDEFKFPNDSPKPSPIPKNLSPKGGNSPRNNSPKSSPIIKHMYAPTPVPTFPRYQSISPKPGGVSPKQTSVSPKQGIISPKPGGVSPKQGIISPKPGGVSPKQGIISPKPGSVSPKPPKNSAIAPKPQGGSPKAPNGLTTNEILEKYKIQNLAQLTASLNFNAANFAMNPSNQLAAIQHAMLLKHIEMQNRQNWLNMNPGPLLQYEKYLQSLSGAQGHILGNIKEN